MNDAKKIPVGRNHIALVDGDDFELLNSFHWSLSVVAGRKLYAHRRCLSSEDFDTKTVKMHRFILGLVGTQFKAIQVDHINGNGLDNRRCNLRACNASENLINMLPIRNKHGFRGISEDTHRRFNRWRARISKNNELVDLGHYPTPELAAAAYDGAARALFGEFARGNFLKPHELNERDDVIVCE